MALGKMRVFLGSQGARRAWRPLPIQVVARPPFSMGASTVASAQKASKPGVSGYLLRAVWGGVRGVCTQAAVLGGPCWGWCRMETGCTLR